MYTFSLIISPAHTPLLVRQPRKEPSPRMIQPENAPLLLPPTPLHAKTPTTSFEHPDCEQGKPGRNMGKKEGTWEEEKGKQQRKQK